MFKRFIYSVLPTPVRIQGRSFFPNYLLDLWDRLRGTVDPNIPPRHLNVSGKGPFRRHGEHNLMLCRKLGHLQPDDAVLDMGCGIGRTALAMTEFLCSTGRYAGFDVIDFAVKWCNVHIAKNHPNFSFVHADVYNEVYNSRGSTAAEEYSVPFPDESFTFCLATSLFTHLLPAATERYIAEASRVLRPGGWFFSTWFLLDYLTEPNVLTGTSQIVFPHSFGHHAQRSLHAPEQAVAYRSDYVQRTFSEAGFSIENIFHGGWSGIQSGIDSGQDVIVAQRANEP